MIKKSLKKKILKSCKGALAIFLCVIFTPFLSIAYSLVEFSRMQGAAETAGEVADMSALSTLSNYDKYLQDRFGLLALSQDSKFNLQDEYNTYFNENVKMLGGAVDISNTESTVSGKLPLSDTKVLKSQILDYSESTVLIDILNDDFNLEKLIDEINKFKGLTNISNFMGKMYNYTNSVDNIVKAADGMKNVAKDMKGHIEATNNSYKNLKESIEKIINKIKDDKKDMSTEEAIKSTINDIVNNKEYVAIIEEIYDNVNSLLENVDNLKKDIEDVSSKLNDIKTSLKSLKGSKDEANSASNGIGQELNDKSAQNISESSSLYDTVISEIEKAIKEAEKTLTSDLKKSLKTTVDDLKNEITTAFGLGKITLPLKFDDSKEKVKEFLKESIVPIILEVWENGDFSKELQSGELLKAIEDELFEKTKSFFDDVVNKIKDLDVKKIFSDAIDNATKSLIDSAKDAFFDFISSLVAAIKGIFDMDLLYDTDLDAFLSKASIDGFDKNNEYQDFIDALYKFFDAANKLKEIFSGKRSIFDILGAFKDTFDGLGKLASAVQTKISKITNELSLIGKSIKNGTALNDLYNKLLISGYATHNFPNRTNKITKSDNSLALQDKATTGYEYKDIKNNLNDATSKDLSSIIKKEKGIQAITTIFQALNDGGGKDTTFKGAELEYINVGTQSEIFNQAISFLDIYFIRMLVDLIPILSDPDVINIASELGAPTMGIGTAVYYILLIIGEPLLDTLLLVNGAEIDIIRTSCYLTMDGLLKFVKELGNVAINNDNIKEEFNKIANDGEKLSLSKSSGSSTLKELFKSDYDTHMLLILLLVRREDDILKHISGLIQFESKYNSGNDYSINKAYTTIHAETEVQHNTFLSNFQLNDKSIMKKKYVQDRGY